MSENIDIKEVANKFGMKVGSFANFIGYSKQALYKIHDGTNGVCTPRYHAALRLLKSESDKQFNDALELATLQKQDREKLISEMARSVGAINVL